MFGKAFCTAALVLMTAAAVSAADRAGFYLDFSGDENPRLEVLSKSKNVKVSKLVKLQGRPGRQLGISVDLDDLGCAEFEMKVRLAGKGKVRIAGMGFADQAKKTKSRYVWIDCTDLEINGQTVIPMGKRKVISFSRWCTLAPDTPINGEYTMEIKAAFIKTSEERVEFLTELAKKKAAGKKAAKKKPADK